MITEVWTLIVGWPHYEVSDQGQVRSIDRRVLGRWGSTCLRHGRVLKQSIGTDEYRVVTLSEKPRRRLAKIHHLVAEAFIGPRPEGTLVLHWDDDPGNNQVSNLRYGTQSENINDAVRNGSHPNSSKTHCPQKHLYDDENTYRNPSGDRFCRTCNRLRAADFQAKKKSIKDGDDDQ